MAVISNLEPNASIPPQAKLDRIGILVIIAGLILTVFGAFTVISGTTGNRVVGHFFMPHSSFSLSSSAPPLDLSPDQLEPGLLLQQSSLQPDVERILEQRSVERLVTDGLSVESHADAIRHDWLSYIQIPESGTYLFSLRTKARAGIALDYEPILATVSAEAVTASVRLSAGYHVFQVWLDGPATGSLEIQWAREGLPLQALAPTSLWRFNGIAERTKSPFAPLLSVPRVPARSEAFVEYLHAFRIKRTMALEQGYRRHWNYQQQRFPHVFPGYSATLRSDFHTEGTAPQLFELRAPGLAQLFVDGEPMFNRPEEMRRQSSAHLLEPGLHQLALVWKHVHPDASLSLLVGPDPQHLKLLSPSQLSLPASELAAAARLRQLGGLVSSLGLAILLTSLGFQKRRFGRQFGLRQLVARLLPGRFIWGGMLLLGFAGTARLSQLDIIPPHGETMDEYANAWNAWHIYNGFGPRTWADKRFHAAYPEKSKHTWFGNSFTVVYPYVDRPPLFPLLLGCFLVPLRASTFFALSLGEIRLFPVFCSLLTLALLLCIGRDLVGEAAMWLGGTLYAVSPLIVWSNKLAKEENLLTLLFLVAVYCAQKAARDSRFFWTFAASAAAGLCPWCKEVGVAVFPVIYFLFHRSDQRRRGLWVLGWSSLLAAAYPLYGMWVAGDLFWTIVSLQSTKTTDFDVGWQFMTDGSVADFRQVVGAGFLVWCWWALLSLETRHRDLQVFVAPYVALVVMLIWGDGVFGWYRIPLYPFLSLAGGLWLVELWRSPRLLSSLVFMYLLLWMPLDQLYLAGVYASPSIIRGMTLAIIFAMFPVTVCSGSWRLLLARAAVTVQMVLALGLSLMILWHQQLIYSLE